MASSVLVPVRGRHILFLFVLVATILAGKASANGGPGYVYETRYTAGAPIAARHQHVTLPLGDGRMGVFGGFGRTDMELFDPATELFSPTRATRWFADFAGATLPTGSVLLVDGRQDAVFDPLIEQFIPALNTHTGGPVRFPVLVPLVDGRVFICGGWDTGFEPKAACGVFDPRALGFKPMGDLAVARVGHTAVLLNEREVLIVGGYGYEGDAREQVALDSLELFDTASGRSARIRTRLHQARYGHCSVRLADGRVLILGGTRSPKDLWLRSAEIFDPRMAAVTMGPDLALGRSGAQAVVLPSGRIAVFGGRYDIRVVEIYDPSTESFVVADSLTLEPRSSGFTATRLASGGVLLVGGRVNDGEDLAQKAEVFEEAAADTPTSPRLTPRQIRELLTSRDESIVNETAAWLVELGPLVKPILETFLEDESSELRRCAMNILRSIDEQTYPEMWCVEIWDTSGRLDTLWLSGFECPEQHNEADPHRHVTGIAAATDKTNFTHVVVRFPVYAPYEIRVRLFNLVGWTGIPKVILGADLDAESLSRVSDQTKK